MLILSKYFKKQKAFIVKEELIKEIEKIKQSGTINANELIFQEFNNYAREFGLDIDFSYFVDSENSRIAKTINGETIGVPAIYVILKNTANLLLNGIDRNNSNWDSSYKYTNELKDKWNKLLGECNFPFAYQSNEVYIFFYSLESIVLSRLVNMCKNNIKEWINSSDLIPKPEFVFCSSQPSYNIIFYNKSDFDNFLRTNENKLTNYINKTLKENDFFNYFEKDKVKINYLHKDMEDINLYGLSRED